MQRITQYTLLLPCICFFAILLFFSSCGKNDDSTNTSNGVDYFFRATIDGEEINFVSGEDLKISEGVRKDFGTIDNGFFLYESSAINNALENRNYSGFGVIKPFNSIDSGRIANNQDRLLMFSVKSYNYANSTRGIGGAVVTYTDSRGILWSSDYENADQSQSSFEITSVIESNNAEFQNIVEANFSCQLFNIVGESIILTNGTARGFIILQ